MEIQKTSAVSGISANANKPPKDFASLQAGASLNAVVAGKSDANTYLLKLADGRLIRAQTLNELMLGQILKLEVVKPGAVPELKIIWPENPAQTNALDLPNTLRQLLPKQVNLADFANTLKQASTAPLDKSSPVSVAITTALNTLLAKDELMTADGVKQAVANSGVFLEAKLAHQLSPQGDMKGQLLALADALQKTSLPKANESGLPPILANTAIADQNQALLAKTEGAIARIVLDQLASLPQNNEAQATWQVSIPFTDGSHTDNVSLNIKREENHNPAQPQANWSVVLELNPPGFGPLHCKISLVDDKVDTYFWSDAEAGMLQVQNNLDILAQRYTEAGLAVGHLNVVDAARMRSETTENKPMPTLLDEFA